MIKKIVWRDEKFCFLRQKSHRKNDGVWAGENPHHVSETNDRNDEKVMIFAAIVHGTAPIIHASLDLHRNKSQWTFLPQFAPRSNLASTASDSQLFSSLEDARWGSNSLL